MCNFVIASDDTGKTMVPALEQKRGIYCMEHF
jgi:hypothetical protein